MCSKSKLVGEEIARLRIALEELQKSLEKLPDNKLSTFYVQEATRLKGEAEKDNNFIYHEAIPDKDTLDAITRSASAKLAKLTPVPEIFPVESEEM